MARISLLPREGDGIVFALGTGFRVIEGIDGVRTGPGGWGSGCLVLPGAVPARRGERLRGLSKAESRRDGLPEGEGTVDGGID